MHAPGSLYPYLFVPPALPLASSRKDNNRWIYNLFINYIIKCNIRDVVKDLIKYTSSVNLISSPYDHTTLIDAGAVRIISEMWVVIHICRLGLLIQLDVGGTVRTQGSGFVIDSQILLQLPATSKTL